jgi:hypothetical protein
MSSRVKYSHGAEAGGSLDGLQAPQPQGVRPPLIQVMDVESKRMGGGIEWFAGLKFSGETPLPANLKLLTEEVTTGFWQWPDVGSEVRYPYQAMWELFKSSRAMALTCLAVHDAREADAENSGKYEVWLSHLFCLADSSKSEVSGEEVSEAQSRAAQYSTLFNKFRDAVSTESRIVKLKLDPDLKRFSDQLLAVALSSQPGEKLGKEFDRLVWEAALIWTVWHEIEMNPEFFQKSQNKYRFRLEPLCNREVTLDVYHGEGLYLI